MIRAFRLVLLKRELARGFARQRRNRQLRAEAAQRGVSTYWHRVAERTRTLFPEIAR